MPTNSFFDENPKGFGLMQRDHVFANYQDDEPNPPSTIARAVATRIGQAGVPGQPRPDDRNKRKFVIDFAGGTLSQMAPRHDIEPVISTSRGTVDNAYVIMIVGTERWRALFDVDTEGSDQIDLRCFLHLDGKALTETWLYQYFPDV